MSGTGRFRVGILRKVECQHERLSSRVFDFHTTVRQRCLSDESNLRIKLAELHALVVAYFEFSNAAASAIRVEERGTLRAEVRSGTRRYGQPENRALLVAKEITVHNPLCINPVT